MSLSEPQQVMLGLFLVGYAFSPRLSALVAGLAFIYFALV